MNPEHYAVVIGIDNYPQYRPLEGAVADAKDFEKWLCVDADGGGIPVANCKGVYSGAKPLTPLQDQIDEAFVAIFGLVPATKGTRRLYVYFSGHGMAPTNLATHLCLANWSERFPNRALDSEEYLQAVLRLGKFSEVVMLFDCCRVRLVAAHGHPPDFNVPSPGVGAPKSRHFTGFATEFLNSAYEAATAKPDAGQGPLVRGYFTRALLQALRGNAAQAGGGVPASKLKTYLEENTPKLAKADGYDQTPEIVNGLSGDPVFGSAEPTPSLPAMAASPELLRASRALEDLLGSRLARFSELVGGIDQPLFPGLVRDVLAQPSRVPRNQRSGSKLPGAVARASDSSQTPDRQLYTATPLANAPTSHEYYTEPSQKWSKETTSSSILGTADSSIFVFIRAVDQKRHDPKSNLAEGLVLLDDRGKIVGDFSPAETRGDNKFGWLAFHALAPHGTLYLRFKSDPVREMPLHLYRGWQTQLFLMFRERPLPGSLKIFMARMGRGFEISGEEGEENEAIDLALTGLQNNQGFLSKKELDLLLYGKFRNPVLGLVGAHILLLRRGTLDARLTLGNRKTAGIEKEERRKLQETLDTVLGNLDQLIPGSPDVAGPARGPCRRCQTTFDSCCREHHPSNCVAAVRRHSLVELETIDRWEGVRDP
jgi:hypothetical protein